MGEAIAPNTTSTPSSASSETTSPAARPPTESTPATIGGVADDLRDAVAPAVVVGRDDPVDALLAQLRDAVGTAYETEHVHATGLGQLGDEAADGAVGGVLHDPVALGDLEEVEQRDRAERHRDQLRGGLVADALGHRDERGGRRHDQLGPRTEGAAAGDALADRQALDALAERLDDADGLGAGAGRHLGLEAVAAAHGPQVVVVDGGEQHPHEDLAGTGLRGRGPR